MKPIIFIMGVAGSGKTTIGNLLSVETGLPFFDADDFHTLANKEKMRAGQPLTDEDREPWLKVLNKQAIKQSEEAGAIISCSALKEKYRILLSTAIKKPTWIFLHGSFDLIQKRLQIRKDHFMPANLLQSQFDLLEVPVNAFSIDIKSEPVHIVNTILQYLNNKKAEEIF